MYKVVAKPPEYKAAVVVARLIPDLDTAKQIRSCYTKLSGYDNLEIIQDGEVW